ncbi:MAG: glycosyltransferase family 39 protein [Endomicrobiia bacterium]|nr:glycosyltransferase family 39 protein [Endomicrobiia bacterium]
MKQYLFIAAVVVALTAPFVNKPFFIDDYYHFLMAKGIIENPLRPYDFRSDDENHNDAGWHPSIPPRMVNPPLMHYYMAALIKIFGPREFYLHLGFIIFPIFSALSLLFIASRFVKTPLLTALILAVSPVFWITSTSFMLDSVKLAFSLGALAALMAGSKKNSPLILALAGLFMGAAVLTKYTAVGVFAVAALYLYLYDPSWKKRLWIFLIPTVIVVGWALWNIATYGSPHMLATLARTGASSWNIKALTALVFMSGGGIFTAGVIPFLVRKNKIYAAFLFGIFALCFFVFSSSVGGFTATQSALIALWITVSSAFFMAFSVAARGFFKNDILPVVWFAVAFLTTVPAMGWTAGRYYMTVLAPASIVFVRIMEVMIPSDAVRKKALAATAAVTFAFGALLAATDYSQALVYPKIRRDLVADGIPPSYFKSVAFIGLTGYLKDVGWRTVVPGDDVLVPGDYFLQGTIASPVVWLVNPEIRGRLKLVKTYEYKSPMPFRVLSIPASAGFYATLWGALPWSLSTLPLERYRLYVVEKN